VDPREEKLSAIIRRQYGVFSRTQARAAGYSAKAIRHRLDTERWISLHPNVLTLATTSRSWHGDQLAACLWARGCASGKAAGFLHSLPGCDDQGLEITTTNRKVMPRCGITVHLTTWMPSEQVTTTAGIPVTTIERTLLDLAGQLPRRRAAIALDNALRRGLTTIGSLDHCLWLTARRGRNGCGVLRDLVKERWSLVEAPTSPLETVVFELLIGSGLPTPVLQHEIRDSEGAFVARVDFAYPESKLIIEGHSKQWHWGVEAGSRDLARHNALTALGWTILYVTWEDATQRRESTIARVTQLISTPKTRPPGGALLGENG
jgi:hypothetical protein